METEQRALDELLFGSGPSDVFAADVDLAEAISAWYRASRSKLREGGSAGRPTGVRPDGDSVRSR